jgi:ABC-type nitrate/sulfonate/bicarbonate transport system substrate-binding protein
MSIIRFAGGARRLAVTTAVLAAATALGGCATGTPETTRSGVDAASLQLGWIANVENMGPYVAERDGYFEDLGLDLAITPGGPSTAVEPLVQSGKALVGLSSADIIARANAEGADLVIVGATLQTNPMSIMSLDSAPIETLDGLVGKRLCVQTSGVAIMDGVLAANGIAKDDVTYVTADFDPSPLVAGDCDAFVSFLNNQPATLRAQGVENVTFPLSDYGYDAWGNVVFTKREVLEDPAQRETVQKVLEGIIRGWQTALDDPDGSAEYIVTGPGADQNLDLDQQKFAAEAFVPMVRTVETEANGLLTMSPDGVAANIATMEDLGVPGDLSTLFDTSLLDEIFADGPTL